MKKFAVIVAGGSGSRIGGGIPKQFLEIADKPILMHTINVFYSYDEDIKLIIVLPQNQISRWKELCSDYNFQVDHEIVEGGVTRFDSVKNGLAKVESEGIVFIHDGVRPLVNNSTIKACLETTIDKGNAIPVISPSESIRVGTHRESKAVDRTKYYLVQTPQTFKCQLIKNAYEQEYSKKFTDDASVIENTGNHVWLVDGNRENIKITFPEDLAWARIMLSKQMTSR